MSLLRRVLTAGTLALLIPSLLMLVAPATLLEGIMGQAPIPEYVWIRLLGVAVFALALFHVLILRKLDDVWWWCWALVLFDGLSAVITLLHAAVGVPEGSAAWPWWVYGFTSVMFAALYLIGIAKAGQEKPLT